MIMTEHIFEEERGYGTGVSLELDDGALKPVEEVLPSADGEKKRIMAGGDTKLTATTPEELFEILIDSIKKYHPSDDLTMVQKAYEIADSAHKGPSCPGRRTRWRSRRRTCGKCSLPWQRISG